MITGVRDVYYNVSDLNRSEVFYSEMFGMKKTFGHDHWVELALGEFRLGLHWTEGEKVPGSPRDSHGAHTGATVTFKSDNVKDDRQRLEKAGAKILGETDQPWGHMLVFEDLDGNVLKLMNPKR